MIDEAQRCWSRDYAIRKTRDKRVVLTDSEPGHLLDIMARHQGFAALVCLVGSGQEIHDGEGGLAEWGIALAGRPHWRVVAPPDALTAGGSTLAARRRAQSRA
ncbi:MAG: DNA/RNA helicase domain-containing protein [Rhodospirillales bacterium]